MAINAEEDVDILENREDRLDSHYHNMGTTAASFENEHQLDWTTAQENLKHALSQACSTRPSALNEQSDRREIQNRNHRNPKTPAASTPSTSHPLIQTHTRLGIPGDVHKYPTEPSSSGRTFRPLTGDPTRAHDPRPGEPFATQLRLIPIIVGSILPLTLLLSIICITGPWIHDPTLQVRLANERNVIARDDVGGMVHGIAIAALVCDAVAVAAFTIRCLERHIWMATLVNVIFSLAAAVCHLVGGITFITQHPLGPNQTYDVRLYCVFISAGFSMITTMLLQHDWRAIHNFRHCGSGLTDKQRVLFLIIIMFFSWLVVGGLLFALLERWDIVTALYFSLITVSSIGFGDYTVTRNLSRALLFPYGIIGIILFGATINAIHTVVMETIETAIQAKVGRFYKKRQEYRERVKTDLRRRLFHCNVLHHQPKGIQEADAHPIHYNVHHRSRWSRIIVGITSSPQPLGHESSSSLTKEKTEGRHRGSHDPSPKKSNRHGKPVSLEEHMQRVTRQRRIDSIIQFTFALSSWLIFWLIGAVIFSALLDITYYEAFYFCFVAFTTIGYGEITPHSDTSKIVFIFFILIGIAAITYFVSTTTGIWRVIVKHHMKRVRLRRRLRVYYGSRFNYWRRMGHVLYAKESWWRWGLKLLGVYIPRSGNDISADHSEPKDITTASTGNESPPKDVDSKADTVAPYSHHARRPDPLTDPLVAFALRDHLEDLREAVHNFDTMAALLVNALRLAVAQQDPTLDNTIHPLHSGETAEQLPKSASDLPSVRALPKHPTESAFSTTGGSKNLHRDNKAHPNLKTILQALANPLVAPANFKYHEDSLLHPRMISILNKVPELKHHSTNPEVHLAELKSYYASFTRIIGITKDILNRMGKG